MKQAFYYMFKNVCNLKKTYLVFVFILISTLISNFSNLVDSFVPVLNTQWHDSINDPVLKAIYVLLSFLSIVIMFVPNGYLLECLKSLNAQQDDYDLPEMNLKANFTKGLKYTVAFGIIYALFVLVASFTLAVSIASAIVLNTQAMFFVTIALIALLVLGFLFYFPIFNYMFANKSNLLTFFRYILATKVFTIDKKQYLKGVGLFMLVFFVSLFVIGFVTNVELLKNPIYFAFCSIFTSLVSYYVMLVITFLISKAIKPEALNVLNSHKSVYDEEDEVQQEQAE